MAKLTTRDIIIALSVAAIYGLSFVAIQFAIDDIPPLLATAYRYVLTALPLIFFVKRPKVSWALLAAFGVAQGTIMFGLIFTAIDWGVPGGLASLIVQLQVFFTILFSAILFQERPKRHQLIGASVAFIGIAVIGAVKAQSAPVLPFLMVIASAATWGIANIIAKKAKPNNMISFIVWSAAFAPLPLFVLSMLFEGTRFGLPNQVPGIAAILSVIFLAYITTVLAFSWWVGLLNKYSAAAVTPFALLIPVFGIGSMALVFGERLTIGVSLGCTLVFLGLAINVFAGPRQKAKIVTHESA